VNTWRARAVIFDMDGVLVDSEPVHLEVACKTLTSIERDDPAALTREFVGHPVHDMLQTLVRRYGLPGTVESYETRYHEHLLSRLAHPLPPRDGAVWLIEEIRRRSCRVGLASSAKLAWIVAMLRATGLEGRFDVIVSIDMVDRPKPAPDVYLRAASTLGIAPAECVAVEDSPVGIEAAHAAGLTALGLATGYIDSKALVNAAQVLASLRDFPLDHLAPAVDAR